MKTVLDQLKALDSQRGAYEANFFPRVIARLQQAYAALMNDFDAVSQAQAEGVIEVTIRSRTQHLTIAVDEKTSAEVAGLLIELLGDRLETMEANIIREHETLHIEGESAERIRRLALLQTPVDAQGLPVVTLPPHNAAA